VSTPASLPESYSPDGVPDSELDAVTLADAVALRLMETVRDGEADREADEVPLPVAEPVEEILLDGEEVADSVPDPVAVPVPVAETLGLGDGVCESEGDRLPVADTEVVGEGVALSEAEALPVPLSVLEAAAGGVQESHAVGVWVARDIEAGSGQRGPELCKAARRALQPSRVTNLTLLR